MISVTGGSRLDPWVDSYASRANAMRASEIRALFAVASRPEVVSLAGGMPYVQALPLDVLADTAAAPDPRARRAGPAVRLRPGRRHAARADPRGDRRGGRLRAPRRHRRHHRLAAGPRPGHPDLLRPGRRRARRGPVVRRRARRLPRLPVRRRARRDGRRGPGARGALPRPSPRRAPPASGSSSSTRSRTSTTPPASPRARRGAPRSSPSRSRAGIADPRGRPLRPARLRGRAAARDARRRRRRRHLPRARSPRPSRPACGSAGRSRRTASARSWCWPPRPRSCARRTTRS